jgi:hypothetical protein
MRKHAPRILLALGAALFAVAVILALTLRGGSKKARSVTVTVPTHPATTTVAPPPTTAAPPPPPPTTTAPPPPSPPVAMSWQDAGGMVVHPADVDPTWLGQTMRAAGFGWIALFLGGPGKPAPPDPSWIARFRAASGLPVGGWSALGPDPAADAAAALQLIKQDGLDFYIADAELVYGYTVGRSTSGSRYERSRVFVDAFRAAEPKLPAAVSSYCSPDQHDIDWSTWANAGFDFLPQAYVNDLGMRLAPAACVLGAAHWFPKSRVHPTVGSYAGMRGILSPQRYAALLHAAGTVGFSVYPAEVGMSAEYWQAYGAAITSLGIAKRPVPSR